MTEFFHSATASIIHLNKNGIKDPEFLFWINNL